MTALNKKTVNHSGLNINHFTTSFNPMCSFLDVLGYSILLGPLGRLIDGLRNRNCCNLLRLYSLTESDKCLLNVDG